MTAVTTRTRRDLRTSSRLIAAALMPIGPAAIAVLRFIYPPDFEGLISDPARGQLIVAMATIGVFTLLPGVWAALQLTRRHRPLLSRWTAAFLVPGYLAMAALFLSDPTILAAGGLGYPVADITELSDAIPATFPQIGVMFVVFLVGHVVGTVLLGIAATVSRLVPRSVGILLAISQPLHFTAVMTMQGWLDLIAWGLTALGMAFLARRLLRTPDDEWELAPLE